MYRGHAVRMTHFSDIPYELRPGGRYADLVQRVLNGTQPWRSGDDPIEEVRFPGSRIRPMAILVPSGIKRSWGIHRGHKARSPQLSPFVDLDARYIDSKLLGYVTIELTGPCDDPLLIRAYGGTYTPPLPWMRSAHQADGGVKMCTRYWRTYAYLSYRFEMIRPGSRTGVAPDWFRLAA